MQSGYLLRVEGTKCEIWSPDTKENSRCPPEPSHVKQQAHEGPKHRKLQHVGRLGVATVLEALAHTLVVILVLIFIAVLSGVPLPPARPHNAHQISSFLYYNNNIEI
jgi:hypothetical protein